jgi:hypothetical protein
MEGRTLHHTIQNFSGFAVRKPKLGRVRETLLKLATLPAYDLEASEHNPVSLKPEF